MTVQTDIQQPMVYEGWRCGHDESHMIDIGKMSGTKVDATATR